MRQEPRLKGGAKYLSAFGGFSPTLHVGFGREQAGLRPVAEVVVLSAECS